MRVAESGQRPLQVFHHHSVTYLKDVLRQAKVYLRPMQKDLALEPCDTTAKVEVLCRVTPISAALCEIVLFSAGLSMC